MSITISNLEYLLGVAETIINKCADSATINKYYAIKEHIQPQIKQKTQSSFFTLGSRGKENSQSISKLKSSVGGSGIKKREKSKQSIRNSHIHTQDKRLSRERVQSFASRAYQQPFKQDLIELSTLTQLSSILKNAEAYPQILQAIQLQSSTFSPIVNTVFKDIELSLQKIYKNLSKKDIQSQLFTSQSIEVHPNNDQLLQDNRWLLDKLQILIGQNSTLRRMVGQQRL